MIEDVEDDIDELPNSIFFGATMRFFYEIDNGKAGLIISSKFGDLIEIIGVGFHDLTIFRPLPHVLPPMWIP